VPINPTAKAWLSLCDRDVGPLVDMTNFQDRFDAWRNATGIKDWPANALRRSFASHHYATYKDAMGTLV
jgi:hypothetical protein